VNVGPRPGDGTTGLRPEGNPLHDAYRQAQASAGVDRAIARDYEEFPERHQALYEDCASRVDAGKGSDDETSFVLHYRRRVEEQPIALVQAAAVLEARSVQLVDAKAALTEAKAAHADAVAVHAEPNS
jgi:hypothetical protein